MANPNAPTWEESEEVKVPTWAESKEIDAPSWEDSEPYVEPVGTMPKSQFGADIPMPLDVTGVGTPDITPEPTQFRTITDPAALRRRQAEESTWQSLSAGEKLQSDLASTARGGVETAADIVQGAGVAGTKMPATPISSPFGFMTAPGINEAIAKQRKQLAMTPEERRAAVDANPIFQAGKTLREAGEKSFPTIQPESVDRPLADLGQGVASTVAFLPGALAGPGGVAVLGALAGGAGAYNEARQAGADEDKAENAFWINALAGTSEAVPLSRIFKRLDHASGREFTKSLMEMLKSGLEEGTQEVFQTVMSNIAAEHLYDKDREFLDGIVKGGGVGFFTGLLLSSLGVRGGKQAVRDVRGHFNPAIKVANLLDESALQGSPAQTAQTEIHAATDRPEEEQFVKTDFEKPTPEPSVETQGDGKPPQSPITETKAAPELPKIRKGYRAIKIQLPDGTVIDGITNDKTWEIKGKEVVNVGRPVELNGKIKWSDGPLREGEKIVEQPTEPAAEPDESQMDYGEGGEMPHTPGTWEQPKPKDTFEQFLEKQRERKAVTDRVKALELWKAGESGVVELSSNERSNRKLIVSPDVQEIGKWRVTSFDEKGPIGHHVFDSRESALRAALGEHHTDMVKGPTYHSPGEYKVSRVKPEKTTLNEREGGEMPNTPATSFEVPEAKPAAPIDEMPLEGSPEYTALPHYARRYVTEYARNKKVIESGKLASGKKASKKTIAELEKRQKQLIRNYKVSLKPKKGKHPVKAKSEARPDDFITEVLRVGKIKLKRYAGKSDAYNDIDGRAHQAYRDLLLSHTTELFDKNGKTPDQIMRALVGEGNFKAEDYDTFWKKLTAASEARRAYQKGQTAQQITNKFYNHIAKANKRVSRKRVEPKATSQLAIGDKFKMQEVLFEVTAIDKPGTENPEIQLTSEKFGVQRLPEGETLMVDKNSFKESGYKPETDDEGNTLFRKKKNVADQFELPGQEGVFNLAGEKVEGEPRKEKSTWEMTRKEYVKLAHEKDPTLKDRIARGIAAAEPETLHRFAVEKAIREGKDVPPEVLEDYPKLKKPSIPEQEELFSTQHKDIFKRAFEGDEAAFDILDELLRDAYPDDAALHFGRGDPNTVRTAAAFEKLFEDAFKARDFDKILDAIKATSDVSIWKPLLQKFFKAQKTGDKIAALKADWMRAVFNGTRPDGALPPRAARPAPGPRPAQPPPPRPPGGGPRPGAGTGGAPPPRPPPGPPPAPPPQRISPTGITTGPLKSPYRIIKDFSRSIKHALRVRRQRFGVLGTYHPGSTLTTLRFAGDLDTAAHELAGHWTDDRYGIGRPWMNQRGPSPYDAELAKFWIHGSYRPTMPRRLARAEGIAEYIRAYVVNPDAARLAAPNFTVYFEGSIPAPALKAIKDFSNDVRRWYGANPLEQGRLNFRMNPPGLTEKLWDVLRGEGYGFFASPLDRLQLYFSDSLHYAMKAYKEAKRIQGRSLSPEEDFEILARLLPSHDARFSDQLQHGLIDYRARQIMRADGKLEVSRPLDPLTKEAMSLPWLLKNFDQSNMKAFETEMLDTSAYMVHQRALEKAQQLGRTENITGMGAGLMTDVQAANKFFREIANDPAYRAKLAENARRYRLWADHNLLMLLEAGRITQAQFDRIKATNTQYVTMNRLSEEFDIKHGGKSSRAVGTAKQPINRFKGASLEINNVYSNLLEQTDAIQKEAFRNGAMRAFVDSLIHTRRLNEPNRIDLQQFGHIANAREPHTIKVYRNGKVENWKFDKDIYENLKGLTELGIQVPWLLRAIPMFSRYMITHAPSFLLRNPVRDTFQRAVVSNNGSKPWDILRGYSQADLSRMNIFGGGQFGNYIIDKHVWNRELNRVARELVKDPRNILFSPLKLKHAWEELAKKSESVGRIGEFRRAFDVGKSRGYDDYNAALYASAEARGLLDFAKAGTAMRVINQLIPFSNARIRGLARSAFQIKEHPGRFALNWGLFVLAPTLLTMLWNRKDKETWEEYQQLPAYRKDFFWNFKVGHHWIIIPRPHELGVMAGGVERAINRMLGDKHAMEGYGMSVGNALLPVQDPVEVTGPLRTGLELYFNRDSFRGHDIVPGWEKDLNLNLREGTKHASTIGQNLGKILQSTGMGADPRQVDYFLNSLGGWGQMATTVTSPTRTMGEFAAKSTGYSADVPSSTARDVQWDLNFAKENGLTQRDEIKKLKLLREDVLNEKDPAARDRKAKVLRDYATALRAGLEKMGPLKQKLPAKVR